MAYPVPVVTVRTTVSSGSAVASAVGTIVTMRGAASGREGDGAGRGGEGGGAGLRVIGAEGGRSAHVEARRQGRAGIAADPRKRVDEARPGVLEDRGGRNGHRDRRGILMEGSTAGSP